MKIEKKINNRSSSRFEKRKLYPYLWILAVIPFILIYRIYPMIFSFILSFFEWTGFEDISKAEFIWFANYLDAWKDKTWLISLRNTFVFVTIMLVLQNFFGYLSALVLFYSGIKSTKIIRAIIFFPMILSSIIVGLVWKIILSKEGLLNLILEKIGLEALTMSWLGNKVTPIIMIALVQVWQQTGFNMIFYLAGLQDVPQDLVDASKIDGASWFQTVTKVITPYITPIITVVIILNLIGGFRVFDLVYALTKGGPVHSSEVISSYIVFNAFGVKTEGLYGYASTLSVYLVLITAFFAFLRIRMMRRSEEEWI